MSRLTSPIVLETGHSKQQQGGCWHWCTGYSYFSLAFKNNADCSSSAWAKTGYRKPCKKFHVHHVSVTTNWLLINTQTGMSSLLSSLYKFFFNQGGKLLLLLCQLSPKVCSAALKTKHHKTQTSSVPSARRTVCCDVWWIQHRSQVNPLIPYICILPRASLCSPSLCTLRPTGIASLMPYFSSLSSSYFFILSDLFLPTVHVIHHVSLCLTPPPQKKHLCVQCLNFKTCVTWSVHDTV